MNHQSVFNHLSATANTNPHKEGIHPINPAEYCISYQYDQTLHLLELRVFKRSSLLHFPILSKIAMQSIFLLKIVRRQLLQHRKWSLECNQLKADSGRSPHTVGPWYRPILRLLRNPTVAFWRTELSAHIQWSTHSYGSHICDRFRWGQTSLIGKDDMELIIQAGERFLVEVFSKEGVGNHRKLLKEDFRRDVSNLEHSALLAIIASRLPNLRVLELTDSCPCGPWYAPWLQRLVEWVHADIKNNPNRDPYERPLSRLKHIRCPFVGSYGWDLESVAPYIALPSVWLEIERNEDDYFDWPNYLPRSNVREILLDRNSIAKRTIRKFATQALRGPCLIRHSWEDRSFDDTPAKVWNRLEVPHRGAAKEEIIIKLVKDKVYKGRIEYLDWEIKPGRARRSKFDREEISGLEKFNSQNAAWNLRPLF
ncbi:hypothetical protein F5884DRAFT_784673 [Xylogone sp. PMI_703]|nr:hypothetical protein F5884DRAFT_784673 [Xylogone sp. PMI_703]